MGGWTCHTSELDMLLFMAIFLWTCIRPKGQSSANAETSGAFVGV